MTDIANFEINDKAVALPVDKKKLGDFISGLLGQPQTLERIIEEPFSVDHQWFIGFFSLLQQRIEQQNSPENLSFEATIRYEGRFQRKISSWEAFLHFSETRPIISTSVKFNLALLIQFPGKSVPERQEIILTFDSRDSELGLLENLMVKKAITGIVGIEIRHTERTWADDIFRLIEDELKNIQTPESAIKKRTRKLFFPLASFSFPIMMIAAVAYGIWSKREDGITVAEKVRSLGVNSKIDLQTLHSKVDILLAQAQNTGDVRLADMTVFIYSGIVAAILFFGGLFLSRPNPSFVILSPAAEKNKNTILEKLKLKNLLLLLSIVGSLILGIAGNYIYDMIK